MSLIPDAKLAVWSKLPPKEAVLQCMAYLADVVKVREKGGNNRGPEVAELLKSAGLGEGYAWCAAALTFARKLAGMRVPKGAAAVRNWVGFLPRTNKPGRGSICYRMNPDGVTGHIGVVVAVVGPVVFSIEGNTSSGEAGSQRDGDGLYRRRRLKGFWTGFLENV